MNSLFKALSNPRLPNLFYRSTANSYKSVSLRRATMTNESVQVLQCDPSSITFPAYLESTKLPEISSARAVDALKQAAHRLIDLEDVVAFTTETVYGLGANALSSTAVSRIFSAKGRPADNPLIVHVSSLPMLRQLLPATYTLSPVYHALIEAFWPGPLTLLFPADPKIIPREVTAGHPTVGIRMPSHPVARALIAFAGVPLAAPSANVSGKPSATRAEHVLDDLGKTGRLRLILDGGPCPVGVESTVVDGLGEDGNLRVLRPGGVSVEDLKRVMQDLDGVPEGTRPKVLIHRRDYQDTKIESAPTTPGMKYRHYSPSVPVFLLMTSSKPPASQTSVSFADALGSLVVSSRRTKGNPLKVGLLAPTDSPLLRHFPPSLDQLSIEYFALGTQKDYTTSAARLFDGLLTLEKNGAEVILIEEIPEEREGLAFMNRARKAAGTLTYIQNDCLDN